MTNPIFISLYSFCFFYFFLRKSNLQKFALSTFSCNYSFFFLIMMEQMEKERGKMDKITENPNGY